MEAKNILIGITSSIAAYKTCELVRMYKKQGHSVKVVLSENAVNFVSPLTFEVLSENKAYYEQFKDRDEVEHISLCDWADIFVIAPISANTISKIATGIADNLLTSIACAFIGTKKPILIAPAMNTNMWNNSIIQENIKKLKKYAAVINPEEGFLACGTEGKGRLADIKDIFFKSLRLLYQKKKNNSKKLIVTIGGTKEYIDNVRYITNASSGKMGIALADSAYKLGFDVVAISTVDFKRPYKIVKVESAKDMLDELQKQDFDYLIMAAAVADFRTEKAKNKKIAKEDIKDSLELKLVKNPDIVRTIAKNKKKNQTIVGFCLADDDIVKKAKAKLKNKNLDYIVANDIKTALSTDKNKVTIIGKNGKMIEVKLDTKENIARKILEATCD